MKIGNILGSAVASVSLLGAGLWLNVQSNYRPSVEVKRGNLDSGVPYIIKTNTDYRELEISLPGARICTYLPSEKLSRLDMLQDNIVSPDGRKISRDEVFYNRALLNDGAIDGNQSVRDYWKRSSIPNTTLREKVIAIGNEALTKEGINKELKDGSPDFTTAWAREKAQ